MKRGIPKFHGQKKPISPNIVLHVLGDWFSHLSRKFLGYLDKGPGNRQGLAGGRRTLTPDPASKMAFSDLRDPS